jgi:hypothetical protein
LSDPLIATAFQDENTKILKGAATQPQLGWVGLNEYTKIAGVGQKISLSDEA